MEFLLKKSKKKLYFYILPFFCINFACELITKTKKKMKKLFSLLVIAGLATLIACGPSAEEKAAAEKKKQDSIAAVQKAIDDSIAAAQQAIDDSIAVAKQQAYDDSVANATKKGGKTGTKPTTPTKPNQSIPKEKVKAGQGKG